jgi:hypothetical protein
MVFRSCSSTSPRFRSIECSSFGGKSRHRSSLFAPAITSAWLARRNQTTYAYLDIDLVSTKNNGDVLTDTLEITMPVGDVLVGDTGGDVEHDDTTLTLDVVTVAETTELLLTGSVPYVETDVAKVCAEA